MYKEVYGLKTIERFYKHDYSSHYSDPIYEIFCYKTVKGKLIKHVEMYFENKDMECFVLCPYGVPQCIGMCATKYPRKGLS